MIDKTHFDVEALWLVVCKVFSSIPLKAIVSTVAVFLLGPFNNETNIITSVYLLMGIDTITGVWCAAKKGEVSSRKFYHATIKSFVYFIFLIVPRIIDRHLPIALAAPMMDIWLVTTEGISILENLGKLGFPIPAKVLNLLKTHKERLTEEKNEGHQNQ